MKTRQEMIYEFMMALASNAEFYAAASYKEEYASDIYEHAASLTNKYLESLG